MLRRDHPSFNAPPREWPLQIREEPQFDESLNQIMKKIQQLATDLQATGCETAYEQLVAIQSELEQFGHENPLPTLDR